MLAMLEQSLTLVGDFEMETNENLDQVCRRGVYKTRGWSKAMHSKAVILADACRRRAGALIGWLDADVVVFRDPFPEAEKLLATGLDVVFQSEGPVTPWNKRRCAGVVFARATEKMARFFERVASKVGRNDKFDDQNAVNSIISNGKSGLNWGLLPGSYANPGNMGSRRGPLRRSRHDYDALARDKVLYHANWMRGVAAKEKAMRKALDALERRLSL